MKEIERLEQERDNINSQLWAAHKRYGEWLRLQRQHVKVSLREMARKLGVSAPFLSDVERGNRNSSKDMRDKISKWYKAL